MGVRDIVSERQGLLAVALAAVVVAGAGGYVYLNGVPGSSPTGNVVKDALELSTGSNLEVLRVKDLGGLSQVTVKPRDGSQVTDVYVTSDGKYIVQNPIDVQNFTRQAEARNDFVSCLAEENAQFYGILAQNTANLTQYTQMVAAQAQLVGGSVGSQLVLQQLFAGTGSTQEMQQQVLNNGIVWTVGGQIAEGDPSNGGLMTVPELEEATGCAYSLQ